MTSTITAPVSRAFLIWNLAVISLLWGSSFIVLKTLTAHLPPLTIAAMRGLCAAAALIAFFVVTGRTLRPTRLEILIGLLMGTLHGWLANALVAYGVSGLGAGLAAMLQSSTPLFTVLLAIPFLPGDRLSLRHVVGVVVGFVGVGVLIGPEAVDSSAAAFWPALAMCVTSISYAIGNIVVRKAPPVAPERIALGQQLVGGIFALALSLLFEPHEAWAKAPDLWLHAFVFGALMSALPFALFMRLIQRAGPVRATMAGYLVPLVATVLAITLLGESIGLRQIVGAAIILLGVVLVTRR